MVKEKKSYFRDKVVDNAIRTTKSGTSYGYLNLPSGVNVFTPEPEGRYKLDFLPYIVTDPKHPDRDEEKGIALEGDPWWKRPYKRHTGIGASGDSVVCLTSIHKKCPICEHRAKLALGVKEGKVTKEELASLNASERCLYVVIPLDSKKHDPNIHIFDISTYNFQKLLTEELKEDRSKSVFPDLEEGLTLKVRFEAKTVGNSKPFPEASRIDFLERDEIYNESVLEEVPNLDEVLHILSYDELNDKFLEIAEEEDGGKLKPAEEEEEEDTRRTARTRKEIKTEKPVRSFTRKREEDNGEEKETHKETTVHRTEPAKSERRSTKEKERCPYNHKFGVDTEKFKDCEDCEIFDDCLEEKESRN